MWFKRSQIRTCSLSSLRPGGVHVITTHSPRLVPCTCPHLCPYWATWQAQPLPSVSHSRKAFNCQFIHQMAPWQVSQVQSS